MARFLSERTLVLWKRFRESCICVVGAPWAFAWCVGTWLVSSSCQSELVYPRLSHCKHEVRAPEDEAPFTFIRGSDFRSEGFPSGVLTPCKFYEHP